MIGFARFFELVRGHRPYPWQQRLAQRCAEHGPPGLIAVSTGAGKTRTVDALVWALAQQADRPAAERTVGTRIVWAIDRRILVDQVYEEARELAEVLAGAQRDSGDPLHGLASRLASLSGGAPLVAARWRGGIDRDENERDRPPLSPLQPQIITSTVAQIGSRLLFRGYGLSERSLAYEAGLAACDTTICLDEAHIAEPFRQTVAAVRAERDRTEQVLTLPGLQLITLTATPGREADDGAITLIDQDREALRTRRLAPKRATLEESVKSDRERETVLVKATIEHVSKGAPTVACVVNTVRRARTVFDELSRRLPESEAELCLLVGPQRPADRRRLLERHGPALFHGEPPEKPVVCVATQTFEVGLDADVSAMVTESASATALVQRLGRLNRRGAGEGVATIVRDSDNWLYGADEEAAWEWLRSRQEADGTVDVSIHALERNGHPAPRTLPAAPTLTPPTIELLAQTSPRPGAWQDPDVDVFLRGDDSTPAADVGVCWRCDLRPDVADPAARGYRAMLLQLVPPQRQELVTMSVSGARALLAAQFAGRSRSPKAMALALDETDVEGEAVDAEAPDGLSTDLSPPFLVFQRGTVVHGTLERDGFRPSDLRPGDVLVLPTATGGVDEHALAPGRLLEAPDVAGDREPGDGPAPIRLSRDALGIGRRLWRRVSRRCRQTEDALARAGTDEDRREALDALVTGLLRELPDHRSLSQLTSERRREDRLVLKSVSRIDDTGMPFLDEHEEAPYVDELAEDEHDDDEHDDDEQQARAEEQRPQPERTWVLLRVPAERRDRRERNASPPPTLDAHGCAVRDVTADYANALGLPHGVREALLLAASAHDHGKADARIQAFFRQGVASFGEAPIAKSVFGTGDPRASRLAASLAGLPRRLRHEIGSVEVLAGAIASGAVDADAVDIDLALYLIGTHHGLGRPIPRVPAGGLEPTRFWVDAAGIAGSATGDGLDGWDEGAWLERFWRVVSRYGPWGTAYLEAVLVLADHVTSSRGE